MEKGDVHFRLSTGGERVEMMTLVEGTPKLQIYWNADDVDGLIRILSSLRMDMSTDVPYKRPKLNKVRKVKDPTFTLLKDDDVDSVALSLRHSGFGWIEWIFSKEHLARILAEAIAILKS